MFIEEVALDILNDDLNMPTQFFQLSSKRNEVRRGNITIYFGCPTQASHSEKLGANGREDEHYLARGVRLGIPWYATATNPIAA